MTRHTKTTLAIAVVAGLLALRTDRLVEAARPGDLARLVPPGALVLLDSEDLPALAGRWRDCDLRPAVEKTGAHGRCRASRINLRLDDRVDLMEATLIQPITIERLSKLPGARGGLALYSITDTKFVLWLRTHRGAAQDLELLRAGLDTTDHEVGGHSYAVHRGTDGETSPIAMGVVGDLLIIGNDVEHFEAAFRLAAGQAGQSLADDGTYRALLAKAPASAQAHVYLDMERIGPTRQFQRYWVHDNSEDLAGMTRAMLSVTWEDDRAVEHRVIAYRDGGTRMPAGGAAAGADDRLAALPRGAYGSISETAEATDAAAASRWVWPGGARGKAPESLASILAPGEPARVLEVVRPALASNGFAPADTLAVGILLAEPGAVTTDAVVSAGETALTELLSAGRAVAPTRSSARRSGIDTVTLSPPLPGGPDLSVARSVDGAVLVLASGSAVAAEVAAAAAPGEPLGRALRAPGPDVARVDYDRAERLLRRRVRLLTRREGSRGFLGRDVPQLMGAADLSRIERIAWRDGDLDRQELRYVY